MIVGPEFSPEAIRALATMAGENFDWNGKFARQDSNWRKGIRAFLFFWSKGFCARCGKFAGMDFHVAHVVSSGGSKNRDAKGNKIRRGFVAGNLFLCCEKCNYSDGKEFDIIPFSKFARPELVPTMWPETKELRGEWADMARRENL